jgi:hypothetical protein
MENQEQSNQNENVEVEQSTPVEVEKEVKAEAKPEKETKPEKMLTQAEVDKIVKDRLAKEQKKIERANMSQQELIEADRKEKEELLNSLKEQNATYQQELATMKVTTNLMSVGLSTEQIENIKQIAGGNLKHLNEKSIDELNELFSYMLNKPQQVQNQVVFEKEQPKKENVKQRESVFERMLKNR